MPGLPGMGGKRAKARQQASAKRVKRGSGNPAKRAAQERAAAAGEPSADPNAGAAAFGFPQTPAAQSNSGSDEQFELPKELRDLLG